MTLVDAHAMLFLAGPLAARVDELRASWDRVMKAQIGPHVTVTYTAAIPTLDVMSDRVAAAAKQTPPFRLRLGRISCFGRPDEGVFIEVAVTAFDGARWVSISTHSLRGRA